MEPFPKDVQQFLQTFITSTDQLEILRVLGDEPNREWVDPELAKQVQITPETIRSRLHELKQLGFIRCRSNGDRLICQYGPQTVELEKKLQQLLVLYRQRPVTMIRMIYERPANALRNFADAFRLKSKE